MRVWNLDCGSQKFCVSKIIETFFIKSMLNLTKLQDRQLNNLGFKTNLIDINFV